MSQQVALDTLDAWREIGEFITSDTGARFLDYFNTTSSARAFQGFAEDGELAEALIRTLLRSDIYSARPDMVDLVSAMAESIPHHPILAGDELPSDYGFIHLASPIATVDIHDKPIRAHALQWWPTTVKVQSEHGDKVAAAVAFALWSRWDDPEDYYSTELRNRYADQPEIAADRANALKWSLLATHLFPADQQAFDVPLEGDSIDVVMTEDAWKSALFGRWLLSFWLIVKEQMIEVVDTHAPRSARRRLQQATGGALKEIPEVKVVDLRRRERSASQGQGGSVDWSHRWGVRPHWRRQWYPSVELHKLKLIPGHVKGPDDKPLKLRPTVFDVRPPRPE